MAALGEEEEEEDDEGDSDHGISDGGGDRAGDGSGDGTDGKSGNGSEAAGEDGKDGKKRDDSDENQGDDADEKKKRRLRAGPLVTESVKGKIPAYCEYQHKVKVILPFAMLVLLQIKVSSLSPGFRMLLQMLARRQCCVAN